MPHYIKANLLEIPGLGLPLAGDYPELVHAEVKTMPPRRITTGNHKADLSQDWATGHYTQDPIPDAYHARRSHSKGEKATDELPWRSRPRSGDDKLASMTCCH